MEYNKQIGENKKGEIEVPAGSNEEKLYALIDAIDTAFDIFKPNMEPFEKYLLEKIKKAHEIIHSPDGFKLVYTGSVKHPEIISCPVCMGEGYHVVVKGHLWWRKYTRINCNQCNGTGDIELD